MDFDTTVAVGRRFKPPTTNVLDETNVVSTKSLLRRSKNMFHG